MVPKINVYLSDELAEAVKEAGLPVSAICQRALEQAVARVTAIRETVVSGGRQIREDLDSDGERFSRFTARARTVVALGIDEATAAGARIGTEHLLSAMLAEGGNLAVAVLTSLRIEPQEVAQRLRARMPAAGTPTEDVTFTDAAQEALRLTVSEATSLGHNYVGCEHLLLGLVGETTGTAGQVLREMGAEPRLVRHAVSAALAGFTHLKATTSVQGAAPAVPPQAAQMLAQAVTAQLAPIVARLDALEQRLNG
jgi:ATP-dependent Clp protease ATP-binding subunit ClpA